MPILSQESVKVLGVLERKVHVYAFRSGDENSHNVVLVLDINVNELG